ncbi:MAG: hypothetical protein MZV70_22270 [Desulfobacterales bacterium]|nr:hypothetical protein [Desulfobacterales bacterium]
MRLPVPEGSGAGGFEGDRPPEELGNLPGALGRSALLRKSGSTETSKEKAGSAPRAAWRRTRGGRNVPDPGACPCPGPSRTTFAKADRAPGVEGGRPLPSGRPASRYFGKGMPRAGPAAAWPAGPGPGPGGRRAPARK